MVGDFNLDEQQQATQKLCLLQVLLAELGAEELTCSNGSPTFYQKGCPGVRRIDRAFVADPRADQGVLTYTLTSLAPQADMHGNTGHTILDLRQLVAGCHDPKPKAKQYKAIPAAAFQSGTRDAKELIRRIERTYQAEDDPFVKWQKLLAATWAWWEAFPQNKKSEMADLHTSSTWLRRVPPQPG